MNEEIIEKHAKKNLLITMLCQIMYVFISFVCRTVFTYVLGVEYLGLNGLFSNVLYVLSFVELGLGNAIIYKLYKPLHDGDEKKINAFIMFYKKIYRLVIILVTILGIMLLPFINVLTDHNYGEEIYTLYFLFLLDTIVSYFFVYKKSLLIADQKNFVVELYTLLSNIIINIVQIIVVYCTHSFIFYLLVKIVFALACNIAISLRVDQEYPYTRFPTSDYGLSLEEKQEFNNNLKGLIKEKIAAVSFTGTDNIFLSIFCNIITVGVVSQYTLILSTVNTLLTKIYSPLISMIGHMSVDSKDDVEETFRKIYFVNASIYGLICCGMCILLRPFVTKIWLNNDYELGLNAIFLLTIEVCVRGMHYPVFMARSAFGLFSQMRNIFVGCAVLNLILDVVLGRIYGAPGIFLATIISRWIAYLTDDYVLYKYGFNKSGKTFFVLVTRFFIVIPIILTVLSMVVNRIIIVTNLQQFICAVLLISLIYIVLFIMLFSSNKEFKIVGKEVCEKIKNN